MLHPPPISTLFPYTTLFRSKLDDMQQENRELKHNVNHLVERLEAYSKYNEPLGLGYRSSSDAVQAQDWEDRKSTRLNSSHVAISYAVFCLKKKKKMNTTQGS